MRIIIKLIIGLLYASNCLAQGYWSPIDAFIPHGVRGCGKLVPSNEHILDKGEGCRFIIRATQEYKNVLRYRVVYRPIGESGYASRDGKYVDTRRVVSRTKIFKDTENRGFESLRFPFRGTGEYSVLIDSNNNKYFGEAAYFGILYRTPLRLKISKNKD